MYCYLNGDFVSIEQKSLSPMDRGFLLGDGIFETLRVYSGQPFEVNAHWQRLQAGLMHLQIPLNLTETHLRSILDQLIEINHLHVEDASIRITITRGIGPRGIAPPSKAEPTCLITAAPYKSTAKPVTAEISQYTINEQSPLTRFKTLNYLTHLLAKQAALANGFSDAVLLNTQGNIVGTTTANLFMVKHNILYTPSIDCGALPGVTRQIILDIAKTAAIPVKIDKISPHMLYQMDESFICNSLIEVQPVHKCEKHNYKNIPGPVTQRIHERYQKRISLVR